MKKSSRLVFVFALAALLFACTKEKIIVNDPDPNTEINDTGHELWKTLNKYISPIQGSLPLLNTSDLVVLDQFAGTTVIGLGEATHGSKEFFQMKHRIFKYFVEKHGYKIFAFEADMGECIYIDRFITRGIGTIDEIMEKMWFWTWKTEEVKELILWMHNYNIGKTDAEQIHLFGVDCQTIRYNKELIKEYLIKFDNNYPTFIDPILNEINDIWIKLETGIEVNAADKISLRGKCDTLNIYFDNNKSRLIGLSGKLEYDLISRLVKQTQQWVNKETEKLSPHRELYMAENTLWLSNLLGNPTKTICWAHNAHVAKDPNYMSGSQGYLLSRELNSNYKVIGFSFNQGSFRAVKYDAMSKTYTGLEIHTIARIPLGGSYNYLFQSANPKDFLLIFQNIPSSDPLFIWLNTPNQLLSVGAIFNISSYLKYYYDINLVQSFDALIHFRNTTASIAYNAD